MANDALDGATLDQVSGGKQPTSPPLAPFVCRQCGWTAPGSWSGTHVCAGDGK